MWYNDCMGMNATVQARLDGESREILARLAAGLGWSASRAVREGLRLLATCHARGGLRIARQGKFASGVSDLGSNKKHMQGFGR
jgi:hypothetical protein